MRILIAGLLTTAMAFGAGTADAGQPAYVGKWGKDAAQCKNGQEIKNAPMLIAKNGYDSHEVHCSFSSIKKSGNTWTMKTKCSVAGDQQVGTLTLSVADQTLTVDGNWKLKRC